MVCDNIDRIEGIVKNEMSDRVRQIWCGVYVESEKVKGIETHGRLVAAGGWRVGKMGRCWSKGTKFQL